MPELTREQFVEICTKAIVKTRKNIDVANQESGYLKYHRELKEHDYLQANVRNSIKRKPTSDYTFNHDIIEYTGLGNCHELADYLLVEIGRAIREADAKATLKVVSSVRCDHVYLEVYIKLKDEVFSLWEVDAWDPRVIDISTRPDQSIKNRESLDYGYSACTKVTLYEEDFNLKNKRHFDFLSSIRQPVPGPPSEPGTPKHEALSKHEKLYSDHTLEDAYSARKLDPDGKIHYLQRVSFWQQAPSLSYSKEDRHAYQSGKKRRY